MPVCQHDAKRHSCKLRKKFFLYFIVQAKDNPILRAVL